MYINLKYFGGDGQNLFEQYLLKLGLRCYILNYSHCELTVSITFSSVFPFSESTLVNFNSMYIIGLMKRLLS